jgi:hypothetical protein
MEHAAPERSDDGAAHVRARKVAASVRRPPRRRTVTIQRTSVPEVGAAGGDVPGDVEQTLRQTGGRGEALPATTLRNLEHTFGSSLDGVRIHPNSDLAPRLGAVAFTHGRDIHFAPGQFDPSTRAGMRLLAHEATHVVQQTAGAPAIGRTTPPRIQRDFFGSLKSAWNQTSVWASFVGSWDSATRDQVTTHFGLDRFKALLDAAGSAPLVAAGAPALLGANPALPFALPGLTFKQRFATAVAWGEPIGGLQAAVAGASQAERDTVWQDDELLATMRRQIPRDDYLGLLPKLRVLTPGKGEVTADRWGAYDTQTLGPAVDQAIRTNLAHYVGSAVGAGRQVEGEMSVVGDADWNVAFKRQWTKPELQPFIKTANAFVDVNQPQRHIWIHRDRGGPGTAIHEGFHKYSSSTLRDSMINAHKGGGSDVSNLDEGLTEYFTRLTINLGGYGFPRSSYPSQFDAVTKLEAKVGEPVLARAFFDGDLPGLRVAFQVATGVPFDTYTAQLEAGKYSVANGML